MKLTYRMKFGVLAAATVAGVVSGAGFADAATVPASSQGSAPAIARGAQPDVGVPPGGVHPDAAVIAPDGTRIPATSKAGVGRLPGQVGAAASSDPDFYAYTTVSNARLRAWVPNGTVVGLALYGSSGTAGCKIRGGDGWLWGWVGFPERSTNHFTRGWMRGDLFSVQQPWGGRGTVSMLPWC